MHIRLLGTSQIIWQDKPFELARRQLRALLYRLAAAHRPVPREQLAFLFWPDVPTATGRRRLIRLLSSLRAALPQPEMLRLDEESAALQDPQIVVDSRRFQTLAAVADIEQLATAAALYTGRFLDGFFLPDAPEFAAWQEQTARELEHLFLGTLEQLVSQLKAAGELGRAIPYARRLVAVDPLNEAAQRQLISLLAAVGDRIGAQRQYEACALILERELGVSPLPETRRALQPLAPSPRRARAPAAPAEPPLLGRANLLTSLAGAAEQLAGGGLIFVQGEPGMGKTRLLQAFAATWRGQLLWGAGHPGSRQLPYQPLIASLRQLGLPQLATLPAIWGRALLPLLPDLQAFFPELPAAPVTPPDQAQAFLWDALLRAFAAASPPPLLILDDLHWADEATLGWLRFLAGRWSEAGLLLAVGTRPGPAASLAAVRHAWERAGRCRTIELEGLDEAATAALLPANPDLSRLAAEIHRLTAGNPFFVLAIAAQLRRHDYQAQGAVTLPLPATVREAILAQLAELSPLARQVLEAAAVLETPLTDTALQQTAARSAGELADGLDELLAMRLLRTNPSHGGDGALQLAHHLLQQVIYQELTPWRRRLLHRRAANTMHALAAVGAARRAEHLTRAEAWAEAVACWQQACDEALRTHAVDIAMQHIQRALALLPHLTAAEPIKLALLRRRLDLLRTLVQLPAWEAQADELLELAEAARDVDAQLAALEAQMSLHVLRSRFTEMETVGRRALALAEATGRTAAAASLHHTLGWHLADALGRSREGLRHLEEACRLANAAANTPILYQALCHLAFAQRAEGQCAAALESATRALQLAGCSPTQPPQPACADALRELAEANAYLGRWEAAWQQLRALETLYESLHDPWAHGAVLFNLGYYSANMGQFTTAVDAMRRLVALSERVGLPADSDYGIWHRAGLARVLLAAGALPEAELVLTNLNTSSLQPGRPYLAWARAAAELWGRRGDPARAVTLLEPAVAWWRQGASLHDADILVQLALLYHLLERPDQARTTISEASSFLFPTDIHRYRLRLFAARWQILETPADLAEARAVLATQAAAFTDENLRQAFLQAIPLHRLIAG